MDIKQALGRRIRTLRKLRGMTQEKFATEIDRSIDGLSLIERGENWPSVETLERMAQQLEIDVPALFEDISLDDDSQSPDILALGKQALRKLTKDDLPVALAMLQALERKGSKEN